VELENEPRPPSPQAATATSSLFAYLQASIAAIGLGALLYGIGFLAIRAHYAALGVWAGSPDSQEIREEGGRFFFHMLYLPAKMLQHVGWREVAVVFAVPLTVGLIGPWAATRLDRIRLRPKSEAVAQSAQIAGLAVALIASAITVEAVWSVLQVEGLLFRQPDSGGYRDGLVRACRYSDVLRRYAAVVLIAAGLWRWAWPEGSLTARVMIAAQWSITAAALSSWPVVYGKLVMSDARPVLLTEVGVPTATPHSLLLRTDGDTYYIWSKSEHKLELRKLGKGESLMLGRREHLLDTREPSPNESCEQ
jgi:hypothetical protein